MSTISEKNTSVLTDREQQAINNINAVLSGDGSDPESGPGAWGDCGEVDVPVLLDAVTRLSKLAAATAAASDEVLAELEQATKHCTYWLDLAEQVQNPVTVGHRELRVVLDAQATLLARVRLAEARAYPATLTPELDEVLGWPNFRCAGFADAFRLGGENIPPKAEREQAFVLHWLTGLVLKHGAGWREVALSEFEALREKVVKEGGPTNA